MEDLQLIEKALEKAQARGVFTMEESAVILNAVQTHKRNIEKTQQELNNMYDQDKKSKNAIKKSN